MRLRVRTLHAAEDRLPTGAQLRVEVEAGADDEHPAETVGRLDGVQSVTLHCGGRGEPVTAVLVVRGVCLDLDLPMPAATLAALRLIRGEP